MAHRRAVIIILEATGSRGRVLIGKWHDHTGVMIVANTCWKNLIGMKTARAHVRDHLNSVDKMLGA